MSAKKQTQSVVKVKPAKKSVVKTEKAKTEKGTIQAKVRIHTAEGWKREALKVRKSKSLAK